MSIEIKLNAYEGPLDLLLQLIEKNKVDIYDIPIASITDQYMEYVAAMQESSMDLDVLSDFLVMASTLLDIKSRMLLPREEDENGEEIDPRSELVERLIEYKQFKYRAGELSENYSHEHSWFKGKTLPPEVLSPKVEVDTDELLSKITLERLQEVFQSILLRQEEKIDPIRSGFGNIKRDPVRIADKLTRILDIGRTEKKFSFRSLMAGQETKADLVVTFLACLELIRCGQIFVNQETIFGEIDFEWNENCDRKLRKEDIEQYD